ncbi:hypothetical protein MMC18_001931 [Xylographa bjoerkii]|nr:hypothetical protein [Xylographa bjoerkii]
MSSVSLGFNPSEGFRAEGKNHLRRDHNQASDSHGIASPLPTSSSPSSPPSSPPRTQSTTPLKPIALPVSLSPSTPATPSTLPGPSPTRPSIEAYALDSNFAQTPYYNPNLPPISFFTYVLQPRDDLMNNKSARISAYLLLSDHLDSTQSVRTGNFTIL